MTINEIIKHRRKELGMTQKELADILSISDKTVSRWESGNQIPDALLLPDIAEALKITINDLYGIKSEDMEKGQDSSSETKLKIDYRILNSYKIGIIIGLVFVFFGATSLVSGDLIRGTDNGRLIGKIILFSGGGICLITELAYNIIYRSKRIFNSKYLAEDITYSGFTAIFLSVIFLLIMPLYLALEFNYWYELFVVILAIIFEIMMLYHKNQLRKSNVNISKTINTISILIGAILVALLLTVFIVFRFANSNDTNMVAKVLYEMYYVKRYGVPSLEAKVRLYSFLVLTFPIIAMLLINYIELIFKVKKLK